MDLIDRKIICELDENCRIPTSQLAKKLKLGRNVVDYRIKKLEEEQVIQSFISTIDLGKIGYTTYRIYLKTNYATAHQSFLDYVKEHKNIIHCLKTEGYYTYTLAIAVRSIHELDILLMDLRRNFKELITAHDLSILLYTKIFKLNKLLLEQKDKIIKTREFSVENTTVSLDEKDKKILHALAQQANLSVIQIAKNTKLSIDIVKYRLKNLNKQLITANRPIFNLNKLGYYHYVIMLKTKPITPQDQTKFDTWCTLKKNILYYGKRIGRFDFELNVAIKDIDDLNCFFKELNKEFGSIIERYELIINTNLVKLNYLPL